jgi:hypothetical protein
MSQPIRQGLYNKLATTSGVTTHVGGTASPRIFHQQAPPDAAYPLVIFAQMSGTKRRTFSRPNAFVREVWMVKAVDRSTSSNTADAIAAAVDTALNGGTITVTGRRVADLVHVSDIEYLEPAGDQTYRHQGATFAVTTTAS